MPAAVRHLPTAMDPLTARVRSLSDDALTGALRELGGGALWVDHSTVRAALLDEYERRHGDDVDAFMDEIGL